MTIDSVAATLIIGVPSVLIALATLWFSRRAHRQQMAAAQVREAASGMAAESGAYARARIIDESVIAELRRQIDGLKVDLADVRTQLADVWAANHALQDEIARLRGRA